MGLEVVGILVMLFLLVAGVPIFLSMLVGVAIIVSAALGIDPIVSWAVMFDKVNNLILIAVPLFLFSGQLMHMGGGAGPLVRLLNSFMGHIPGGPAYAVVAANVLFAAMSSSSLAAVAGMAPVMIPLLTQMGYSKKFAIGLILVSGSMAPIIPPSTGAIMYGFITETSVMALWTALIIPGLVQAALIVLTIFVHSRRGHYQRLPKATWGERWEALKHGWWIAIMPAVVLGPLYGGIATPTETAAIATVYTLFLGIFIYKGLRIKQFVQSCINTTHVMAAIFVIVMGALLLNVALVYVNVPQNISTWMASLGLNWIAFMALVFVMFSIMGMFLDSSAITLVAVPILFPTILALDISPIMFGVFTVNAVEMAVLTPPYGMLLFAACGLLKENFATVTRSVILWLPAVSIHPIIIMYWPPLSTWLPRVLGY